MSADKFRIMIKMPGQESWKLINNLEPNSYETAALQALNYGSCKVMIVKDYATVTYNKASVEIL